MMFYTGSMSFEPSHLSSAHRSTPPEDDGPTFCFLANDPISRITLLPT